MKRGAIYAHTSVFIDLHGFLCHLILKIFTSCVTLWRWLSRRLVASKRSIEFQYYLMRFFLIKFDKRKVGEKESGFNGVNV